MWRSLAVVAILVGIAHANPPHGATRIVIDYRWVGFGHDAAVYTIDWNGSGYTSGQRAIDAKLVDDLYRALTYMRESDHPLQCTSHTDDYPTLVVAVDGDEPVTLRSTSNCRDHLPWNIQIGGKSFAQFSGAAGRAVRALLFAVDAQRWKPERRRDGGVGSIMLDELPGAQARACATAIESDTRLSKALGAAVRVDRLHLWCDPDDSPDCSAAKTSAGVAWKGLALSLDLTCTAGKLDGVDAAVARVTELARYADSKPVRVLIELSASPPRLSGVRVIADGDLPELVLKDGHIVARVTGTRFWKQLHLDPARLPRPSVTLDLAGHVIRD